MSSVAEEHLGLVVHDIEASTSALSQLIVLLDQEDSSTTRIFTSIGRQEIDILAIKCNLIFKALILLFEKAAERKFRNTTNSGDGANKVSGWDGLFGPPKKGSTRLVKVVQDEQAKTAEDNKANEHEHEQLLVGQVPDLTTPKTMGLIGRLGDTWDWLSNRISYCQIQLRWVWKSLLLHVQMGRLTCLANQYGLTLVTPWSP